MLRMQTGLAGLLCGDGEGWEERAMAAFRVSVLRTRIGVPGRGVVVVVVVVGVGVVGGARSVVDAGGDGDGEVKRGQYLWSRRGVL